MISSCLVVSRFHPFSCIVMLIGSPCLEGTFAIPMFRNYDKWDVLGVPANPRGASPCLVSFCLPCRWYRQSVLAFPVDMTGAAKSVLDIRHREMHRGTVTYTCSLLFLQHRVQLVENCLELMTIFFPILFRLSEFSKRLRLIMIWLYCSRRDSGRIYFHNPIKQTD